MRKAKLKSEPTFTVVKVVRPHKIRRLELGVYILRTNIIIPKLMFN